MKTTHLLPAWLYTFPEHVFTSLLNVILCIAFRSDDMTGCEVPKTRQAIGTLTPTKSYQVAITLYLAN